MSNTDIATRVTAIIVKELGIEEDKVSLSTSFVNDLGLDSLDNVDLVMKFETEFGIEIPDEDAEKIESVQNVVDYITEKQK